MGYQRVGLVWLGVCWLLSGGSWAEEPPTRVAFLTWENGSGDPAREHWSEGLPELLGSTLEGFAPFSVLSRERVRVAEAAGQGESRENSGLTPESAAQIGKSLGAGWAVWGRFAGTEEAWEGEWHLVACFTGERATGRTETPVELASLVRQVHLALLKQLGLSLPPPEQTRLARLMTPSLPAAQAFSRGWAAWPYHSVAAKDLGDPAAAVDYYRQGLTYDPQFVPLHTHLAEVLFALDQIREALNEYRAALELQPDCATHYARLAAVAFNGGETDNALVLFRAALQKNPRDPDIHFNFANALYRLGQLKEALREYRRAFALYPSYDAPDRAFVKVSMGNALYANGKVEPARKAYREALALQPDYAPAHHNLGVVLFQQGEMALAAAEFAAALRADPNYAASHYWLGLVERERRRYYRARRSFQRFLELQPEGEWADRARELMAELAPGRATPSAGEETPSPEQPPPAEEGPSTESPPTSAPAAEGREK